MTMHCGGIVAIISEPKETKVNGGSYFAFDAVSPDTRLGNQKRHYYPISVFVPERNLTEAIEELRINKVLEIGHGDWEAPKIKSEALGKEISINKCQVNWWGMKVLGWFPNRKKEEKKEG